MTTLYIGRAGRDVATMFIDPERIDFDGGSLSMAGTLRAASQADVLVLRQQMLGLSDSPDEPVVPIIFSGLRADSTLDGFYRVKSVTVESPNDGADQAGGVLRWSGQFDRVGGYSSPLMESILHAPMYQNDHGLLVSEGGNYRYGLYFPAATLNEFYGIGFIISAEDRDGDGVSFTRWGDDGVNLPARVIARWSMAANDWYTGSCRFEVGTSLRTFVGRQLEVSQVATDFEDWRLTNDLVRVTWDQANGRLGVTHHNGSAWGVLVPWRISFDGGTNFLSEIQGMRVLRNTPEQVTIRLAIRPSTVTTSMFTADLTIRRGETTVTLILQHPSATAFNYQVQRHTTDASTTIPTAGTAFATSPGIYDGANDASGNRWVLMTPHSHGQDLTNGNIELAGETTAIFGISCVPNYSTRKDIDDVVDGFLIYQFFGAARDRVVVSAR